MNLLGFHAPEKQLEPKEEKAFPYTMYGEDYDIPIQYWQEPVLTEEDVFPEAEQERKPRVKHEPISVLAPLASYRQYTNTQF